MALLDAIKEFESCTWSETLIRKNAEKFSKERFQSEFNQVVERVMERPVEVLT